MKVSKFKASVQFTNDSFGAESVKVEIEEDRKNLRIFFDGVLYVSCKKESRVVTQGQVNK